jgi:hypothetical protein
MQEHMKRVSIFSFDMAVGNKLCVYICRLSNFDVYDLFADQYQTLNIALQIALVMLEKLLYAKHSLLLTFYLRHTK